MTTTTPDAPRFRVRSRLAVVRDALIIGVCVALVIGFLAQVWSAPAPEAFRGAGAAASALTTA